MILLILLIVLCIVCAANRSTIKGYIGESAVFGQLSGLPNEQYRILNDIMLRTDYGTTQIDHVVISVYGVFVIETKNYKGWITGSEYGDYWTKNMYGKKYPFRNPLKQNYAHVKALAAKIGLAEDKFIPIVVFSNSSEIKVNTQKPVMYIGRLRGFIQTFTDIKFAESDLDMLVARVQRENITDKDARKEHVNQIRTNIQDNNAKIAAGICPRCGGQLVERNGKYGRFVGCSGYPKCRYTRNG